MSFFTSKKFFSIRNSIFDNKLLAVLIGGFFGAFVANLCLFVNRNFVNRELSASEEFEATSKVVDITEILDESGSSSESLDSNGNTLFDFVKSLANTKIVFGLCRSIWDDIPEQVKSDYHLTVPLIVLSCIFTSAAATQAVIDAAEVIKELSPPASADPASADELTLRGWAKISIKGILVGGLYLIVLPVLGPEWSTCVGFVSLGMLQFLEAATSNPCLPEEETTHVVPIPAENTKKVKSLVVFTVSAAGTMLGSPVGGLMLATVTGATFDLIEYYLKK